MNLKTGAVAGGHEKTCDAAMQILKKGGNAVDAAVASLFASSIVEPALTSLCGSGYAVVKFGNDIKSYDFYSATPSKKISYDEMNGIIADFGGVKQSFLVGLNTIAVPGNIEGIFALHKAHGSLSMDEIIKPAVRLAEDGVRVNKMQAYIFYMLNAIFTYSDAVKSVYCQEDCIPAEGDILYNHRQAEFIKRLAREGISAYRDEMKAFIEANDTPLEQKDIGLYDVKISNPLKTEYYDYSIFSPPPTSGGGFLLSLYLQLSKAITLKAVRQASSEYIAAIGEVLTAGYNIRVSQMIKSFYNNSWKELLSAAKQEGFRKELLTSYHKKVSLMGNTTHVSIIDRDGNAVSMTTTNGEGSGMMLNDTGIHFNNLLGESIHYMEGIHEPEGGERLTSMMAPSIVLDGKGEIELVLGSGGVDRIPSALFQVILNSIVYGMTPKLAVEHSRIHYGEDKLQIEPGFDKAELDKLKGFDLNLWEEKNLYFGGVNAVDGRGKGCGDSRRGGSFLCE